MLLNKYLFHVVLLRGIIFQQLGVFVNGLSMSAIFLWIIIPGQKCNFLVSFSNAKIHKIWYNFVLRMHYCCILNYCILINDALTF